MRQWLCAIILGILTMGAGIGAPSIAYADAGFVSLEGSDATAFHHDASYTPQLFKYLQGSSTLPVLVYDPTGTIDLSSISGSVSTAYTTNLSGYDLNSYSALYIESPGGCCTADKSVLDGYGSSVKSFIQGGGNLSIENYVGGTYDGVVVGGDAPFGTIQGAGVDNGGVGSGSNCTDGEVVTLAGIAKGFSQPPVDSCWSHQAYSTSYWEKLGYVNLIASSPTDFVFADGTSDGSSFLALGGTLGAVSGAPEVSTWVLMLGGLGIFGAVLRLNRARRRERECVQALA